MDFLKKRKKKRVCVIGLDGVPYSLLKRLSKNGTMPYMEKLIRSGTLHKMKASLPEISAVSWTDFMTGSNPGSHGIFGFTDLKKGSYDLRFPNFLDVKEKTIWDILGQKRKKCIIINQPSTYPARRINGVLISGFVAIDLARAVYPLSYKDHLERIGYQIDIDTLKSREDHEFLWKDLTKTLSGREKALDLLWKEDWDYFEFVITGTDRLHHFMWDAYEDKSHFYHQNFLDFYSQIDRIIEKCTNAFFKRSGKDDGLFLLSDHGFAAIEQEVYLNDWLKREGYLKYLSTDPKSLNDIDSSSQAFAMDPNRIYIHLKDKFPSGCVNESDRRTIKEEITQELKKLKYQGKKVVKTVFDCENIYSGNYVHLGPDLIVVPENGFDMKGSVKKKEIFGRSNLQGMHTWDDAFFWANTGKGHDLCISNLAPFILNEFD